MQKRRVLSYHRSINRSDILVLIFYLRRLQHTGYAQCSRPLLLGFHADFGFLLFQEQLGVVSRELLELDEEITKGKLELVDVVVVFRQGRDEDLYLGTGSTKI